MSPKRKNNAPPTDPSEKTEADIVARVTAIFQRELNLLRKENRLLQAKNAELESRVNSLELHSRRNNIEILNMPESEQENAIDTLMNVGELVGFPLQKNQVLKCHRSGPPRKGADGKVKPAPIVAELRDSLVRENFLQHVKAHWKLKQYKVYANDIAKNSSRNQVSVVRQLPAHQKFLLGRCKRYARNQGIRFCWITSSGKVLLKADDKPGTTITHVKSLAMLDELEAAVNNGAATARISANRGTKTAKRSSSEENDYQSAEEDNDVANNASRPKPPNTEEPSRHRHDTRYKSKK